METRASFIASMRETQQLSPEKDPSPANGDGEQFDSGETEQTFRNLQHFSFVLTFPLISFTIFWSASGEGTSQGEGEESWSHIVLVLVTGCFIMLWDGLLKL